MTDSTDLNGIGAPIELPTPNLPLLRKVLDHIDAHPNEWFQAGYVTETECGTAACIAGHAVLMTKGDELVADYWDEGQAALGLTDGESMNLFHPGNERGDVQRAAEQIAARAGERL